MGSCFSTDTFKENELPSNNNIYRDDRTNDEMTREEVLDRETRQMIESMKRSNGFG